MRLEAGRRDRGVSGVLSSTTRPTPYSFPFCCAIFSEDKHKERMKEEPRWYKMWFFKHTYDARLQPKFIPRGPRSHHFASTRKKLKSSSTTHDSLRRIQGFRELLPRKSTTSLARQYRSLREGCFFVPPRFLQCAATCCCRHSNSFCTTAK